MLWTALALLAAVVAAAITVCLFCLVVVAVPAHILYDAYKRESVPYFPSQVFATLLCRYEAVQVVYKQAQLLFAYYY